MSKNRERLSTLIFRAKEEVFTHLQGGNLAKTLGQGYDFSELREYNIGDDIRHISWINSAKLGEPYVKKMQEERELRVAIAPLVDGRMVIGKKRELLTYILAVLGYSTLLSNNLLKPMLFLGSESEEHEPTKSVEVFEKVLTKLEAIKAVGLRLDNLQITKQLLERIEAKSLLILVGDFFEAIDLSVLAQKHELYVVIVRDQWEEYPKVSADEQLVNPLSGKFLKQSFSKKALEHYAQKLQEHDEKLFEHFTHHHISYVKIYDEEESFEKLEELFRY